jgi:aldose 1-epimerase
MTRREQIAMTAAALTAASCGGGSRKETETSPMTKQDWGRAPDGAVELFTLKNARGMEARIATYGGIVVSLTAPDRAGQMGDVVLGFDSLDGYLKGHPYFGARKTSARATCRRSNSPMSAGTAKKGTLVR